MTKPGNLRKRQRKLSSTFVWTRECAYVQVLHICLSRVSIFFNLLVSLSSPQTWNPGKAVSILLLWWN
jgi:hypothetical protein